LRVAASTLLKLVNIPGRLGSQVGRGTLALDRTGLGLEHEIERSRLGELRRTTVRTDAVDLVLAPAFLALRQSTSGSVKVSRWPDAAQTAGGPRIAASIPTMSLRRWTIAVHHACFTLRSMFTPSGP